MELDLRQRKKNTLFRAIHDKFIKLPIIEIDVRASACRYIQAVVLGIYVMYIYDVLVGIYVRASPCRYTCNLNISVIVTI